MTTLSHYELLDEVGVGGMGTVYSARDERTGQTVAVKVLHPHLARDAEYIRRFLREAQIAQSIDSPNVVKVLDSGREGSSHFLVMEYVPGKTLAQTLQGRHQLPIDEAVSIAASIARGLEAAHERGIVHRDISPQNVIISKDGVAKVADFGVARDLAATAMTATSMLLGKPQYIAPEVVTGQTKVDIRSDIYALGVVLYQMLAGMPPFNAETPYAVLQKQVNDAATPIMRVRRDVPPWLAGTIDRCLAKEPGDRFNSPQDLLAALAAQERFVGASPPAKTGLAGSCGVNGPILPFVIAAWFAGGAAFVVGIVLALLFLVGGDSSAGPTTRGEDDVAPATLTVPATATASASLPMYTAPTSAPVPVIVPTAVPLALPDRIDCDAIRADPNYRSQNERQWFLSNCPPPNVERPVLASPTSNPASNPYSTKWYFIGFSPQYTCCPWPPTSVVTAGGQLTLELSKSLFKQQNLCNMVAVFGFTNEKYVYYDARWSRGTFAYPTTPDHLNGRADQTYGSRLQDTQDGRLNVYPWVMYGLMPPGQYPLSITLTDQVTRQTVTASVNVSCVP